MSDKPSVGGAMAGIVPILIAWLVADTSRPYGNSRDYWIGILIGIGCTNIVRFIFECIRSGR